MGPPWRFAITKSCAALTCDSSNGLKVIAERNVGDPDGLWGTVYGEVMHMKKPWFLEQKLNFGEDFVWWIYSLETFLSQTF